MFNISNTIGIKQKIFKVGVWQPVPSGCLSLSANAKKPFNRGYIKKGSLCWSDWKQTSPTDTCVTFRNNGLYVRALLQRYSPTKLCDGTHMTIFGDFLRPVFSASRVQYV